MKNHSFFLFLPKKQVHSLYIHIPFCRKACHYCDFHFSTSLKRKPELVSAICKELVLRKLESQNQIKTIYFGGGSPSILNKEELSKIFRAIYENYNISPTAEITLEANPDDCSKDLLLFYKELGINRLSIGIQSFFDDDLILMNRSHNSHQAKKILQDSLQIFENITIDLIYGIPTSNFEKWQKNIDISLNFGVPHLSAYALTIEPKTALSSLIKKGKIANVDENQMHEQFFYLKKILENQGFIHYELSNFGKEGFFSQNNTTYWEQKNYMGIGPSAHSFNSKERRWNISNNIKYIQNIENNQIYFETETLTQKDRYNELIMTGLRTKKGVSIFQIEELNPHFFKDFKNEIILLKQRNLISEENNFIKVTNEGLFLIDNISRELFWV